MWKTKNSQHNYKYLYLYPKMYLKNKPHHTKKLLFSFKAICVLQHILQNEHNFKKIELIDVSEMQSNLLENQPF